MALPCVVPRDWLEPPDYETADGELLDEDDHADERSRMLRSSSEQPRLVGQRSDDGTLGYADGSDWDSEEERQHGGSGKGKGKGKGKAPARDAAGRQLPASEMAPPARR